MGVWFGGGELLKVCRLKKVILPLYYVPQHKFKCVNHHCKEQAD